MQRPLAQENWLGGQVRAEQVALDSSSLFPQSLSPSQSQRLGMQRLFSHLNRSEGQVCWMAEGGGLVAVVQAVIVPVALPALLDAAAVGAGELARLALGWGHVGWVRQTSDTVCVQHLVLSAGTLTAPRGGQAQAAAAAVVHPAFVGAHLLLLGIIHADLKDGGRSLRRRVTMGLRLLCPAPSGRHRRSGTPVQKR